MALIIEDGTGITGSNTFVSLAEAQAFLDVREHSVTLTEGLLLRAMDSLAGVCIIDSAKAPVVAKGLINAQIWLAYYIASGSDPSAVSGAAAGGEIKREKVDVLDIEYFESKGATSFSVLDLPSVKASLKGLLCSGSSGTGTGRIDRA